jgi:hypothetical protein
MAPNNRSRNLQLPTNKFSKLCSVSPCCFVLQVMLCSIKEKEAQDSSI